MIDSLPRSLLTGSSSHKTVTAETSRILWLYYNNKVSFKIHPRIP